MTEKTLKMRPLPATARQIKSALTARKWIQPGYRTHHVRPQAPEAHDAAKGQFFAGSVTAEVSEHPGVELYYFSDDAVAQIYFYFGCDSFDPTTAFLWGQMARDCGGILDVGSNTGLFALLAARVAPRGQIAAFEPLPHIAERISDNVALNRFDNIALHATVISSFNGNVELSLAGPPRTADQAAQNDLGPATDATFLVQARSLDALHREGALPHKIDLMRLNTGGDEYQALDGARSMIETSRPTIFCEIDHEEAMSPVAAFAETLGYDMFIVHEEARSLSQVSLRRPLDTEPDTHAGQHFGTAILSPTPDTSVRLHDMINRFAQKPRIQRPVGFQ